MSYTKNDGISVSIQNLDLGDGDYDSDENDDWMFTSNVPIKTITSNSNNADQAQSTEDHKDDYYAKPQTFQDWLNLIEDKYFDERDDLVRQTLQTAYNEVESPFSLLLHVLHRAFFDLYSKRVPISFYALDEMDSWLTLKRTNGEFVPVPSSSQKQIATEFICRSGYNYLDKVNSIFQLDEGDNSDLAQFVQTDNLKSKKLKETVTIILTLKLQHCFDCEKIFFPLIANDQLQHIEHYVGDNKKLQIDYVGFLNKLLNMEPAHIEQMLIEQDLSLKDPSKIKHKTLTKIAEKAVKRYQLNPDDFPYIFGAKNVSSLFYLIKMRIAEKNNGGTKAKLMKWDHLIEAAVAGKLWLQLKLLDRLINLGDTELAIEWAKHLHIPPNQLPMIIIDELGLHHLVHKELSSEASGQTRQDTDEHAEEDWESEIENDPSSKTGFSLGKGFYDSEQEKEDLESYHQLSLPTSSIHLVDTVKGLVEMTKQLFQDGNVIGFDAEWKPVMCRAGEKEYMSILQLALKDRVYILDIKVLYTTNGAEDALRTFFFQFFTKRTVTKIGYGITGDMKLIIGMFEYAKEMVKNAESLVDLCGVSQKILPHQMVQNELYNLDNKSLLDKGLSMLVNRTLGKSLDKTFQVSDWERRPLQEQQLYYAALDAYCLLEVYDRLCYFVKKYDLNFNTKEKMKTKWLKTKPVGGQQRKDKYDKRENKEKVRLPDNKPLYKGIPRPSTKLKVVCDTMLQGLGRQLRNCGVDTLILEDGQDHSVALQISHKEKRIILTRGKPFFMIRGYVGEDMVMWVPDGTPREQVKMVFTRYHIAIRSKDILSRCVDCNSDTYTKIASKEMQIIFELKHDIGQAEMPAEQLTGCKQVDLSNFTLCENGVEIQLDFISGTKFERALRTGNWEKLFEDVTTFYVCNCCGKVFWEGSHHKAVKETYADMIDKREYDASAYGKPG